VGEEPIIAARLDALGRALGLHLIGISGYRSPQHSVEVGGFADDPHTRGEASDTPGVEGVPEATLAEFCLTRPFPGHARQITSRSSSRQSSPRKAAGRLRPGTSFGV
jgi:Peptidase M15